MALNLKINPPTTESHPNLPFWKLGYTPEQVYDLYFPKSFRFICNAERPAVCGRFGNGVERLWRFEFVVKRDEDSMKMASNAKTMEIIMPYLTHAGSKYGLVNADFAGLHQLTNLSVPDDLVQFPVECIEILRSRPFTFSARSCNKWSVGRVILAGDSAHVFPPCKSESIPPLIVTF